MAGGLCKALWMVPLGPSTALWMVRGDHLQRFGWSGGGGGGDELKYDRSRVRSLDYAVAIEDHNSCSRAATYRKLVRGQILSICTWRGQLLIERSLLILILSCLLSACAY